MDAKQRRNEIIVFLQNNTKPISANFLAEHFGVSRQVIVGDIALLRASGNDILATARGYLLETAQTAEHTSDSYVIVCKHDKNDIKNELYCIVDHGAGIVDVSVEHSVYGTITVPLSIHCRYDVDQYILRIDESNDSILGSLTSGVHLHTITCPSPDIYRRVLVDLREKGLLYYK